MAIGVLGGPGRWDRKVAFSGRGDARSVSAVWKYRGPDGRLYRGRWCRKPRGSAA